MKFVRLFFLALALSAVGAPSWATQHDQHKAHHPAGSASAPAARSMPGKTTPEMARMSNHMKAMQEMHNKMMAAKTPEERNALMGEHMKTMQEGMSMMKGMGGMGGMGGPKSPPTSMAERQTMMEQRMDMMQTMMEMMADRLPQTPAKP
jgi:hypothetical protein